MTVYLAEQALLPSGVARNVRLEVTDGRFVAIGPATPDDRGAVHLAGVVLPGFANCHSHAFHRALRGRTHGSGGTFWTWRERMYALARMLDPDSYLALARATYAEMALSGVSAVGEFHYLHHDRNGHPYSEPNVMAAALRQAARDAGIRLTLLDTCYLAGGLTADGHLPLDDVQRRFADEDADAWAARVQQLRDADGFRVGAAVHSVRAVPREALGSVVTASGDAPLHAHVSEQAAENEATAAFYGCTPTQLLAQAGALSLRATAVHATHLAAADIDLLAHTRSTVCVCPTTERDLADGIGPTRELADAGVTLSLGTDQHAIVDLFEEARALELDERLRAGRRGGFTPAELAAALTRHDSIGWPDAGRLEVGTRADLVAVRTDTVRTAGAAPSQLVFAAGAPDVHTVLVDGRPVVRDGEHVLGDVGALLDAAIAEVWSRA